MPSRDEHAGKKHSNLPVRQARHWGGKSCLGDGYYLRHVRDGVLHNSSSVPAFAASRQAATLCFVESVSKKAVELDNSLRSDDCLLCAAEQDGAHAITVGCDAGGFYKVDPNFAARAADIPALSQCGVQHPADGLLIRFGTPAAGIISSGLHHPKIEQR